MKALDDMLWYLGEELGEDHPSVKVKQICEHGLRESERYYRSLYERELNKVKYWNELKLYANRHHDGAMTDVLQEIQTTVDRLERGESIRGKAHVIQKEKETL